MRVLIACEESQAVCKEFRANGHEAYSCDILPCSGGHPEWHIQDDAIKVLYSRKWDLVIAHPPCTYLSNSGIKHLVRKKPTPGFEWYAPFDRYVNWERYGLMLPSAEFFLQFLEYEGRIAIENPIMHRYAQMIFRRKQDQVIQPWMFGHMQQKATCLWLKGLPKLKYTHNVKAEMMNLPYAERAKVHYESPGPDRAKNRSVTLPGIARAMANQWGRP